MTGDKIPTSTERLASSVPVWYPSTTQEPDCDLEHPDRIIMDDPVRDESIR